MSVHPCACGSTVGVVAFGERGSVAFGCAECCTWTPQRESVAQAINDWNATATAAGTIATLREHLASAREMARYWREAATRDERSARALADLAHAGIKRVYL